MKTMAKKKNWLGMLVIILAFGMTVVGCEGAYYDYNASLIVENTGSIDYYVSKITKTNGEVTSYLPWVRLAPPGAATHKTSFSVSWNEGDVDGGKITIYYSSDSNSTNWTSRTYYLSDGEKRTVEIP